MKLVRCATQCLFVALLAGASMPARAGVPPTITTQGRLYDASDHPIASTLSVKFALYAGATGGTPVWTETQSVTFANGYFAVLLGSVTPFDPSTFDGSTRFLGVTVGTDPEMTPRAPVVSVPYALSASPDARFGTNTSLAATGTGGQCTLGQVWLVAGVVAGGVPAAGQLLPISQNTALFSLLGTTYGGDGRTTFALPDLRGAAPNGLTYVICIAGIFPTRS
jgi:tail collar domain